MTRPDAAYEDGTDMQSSDDDSGRHARQYEGRVHASSDSRVTSVRAPDSLQSGTVSSMTVP